MKKKFIMKNIAIFLCSTFVALSVQADNIGVEVVSKERIIDALKPKILTRGLQINDPQAQPTISMQVMFEFDSAQLTQTALEQLAPLGQALTSDELSGYQFLIEGHTDALGSEQYNMELSKRRAQAVGQFLYQNYKVNPDFLRLVGRGEYVLLNKDYPEAAENRRVVITTIQQQ